MRIAVDANVLMDEENQEPDVLDALDVIRSRVRGAEFVVTDTVVQELAWFSATGTTTKKKTLAAGAPTHLLSRGYTPSKCASAL